MSQPFLAEIRMFSFPFPPSGWALCNGGLLPINQNQGLFSLLGTTFGGDGRVNFALPDLRGRIPIHVGAWHTLGEQGGTQSHTLTVSQLPTHTHALRVTSAAAVAQAGDGATLATGSQDLYANPGDLVALHPSSIPAVGGSQPHLNMQPFLSVNYCIATAGVFPSPT
ncbi:phage tail protein [Nocardioides sp. SR21]|uniref:phage tail protein n=1 Tax=Nocardioides sp. SR21 TaxID=2919501 RepID=UPI001FA97D49|nr:tail fiber protein [Nocardioides sp. SR21]